MNRTRLIFGKLRIQLSSGTLVQCGLPRPYNSILSAQQKGKTKKRIPSHNNYTEQDPTTAAKMEGPDTFHQLPLTIDPSTKAISTSHPTSALTAELHALNSLHRSFIRDIEAPHTAPPPPVPVNPKRSAQITKLKETGNASFKKSQFGDAVRMYSLALDMALARPLWEPAGLVREELSMLYGNRAQAHMAQQNWAEAAVDAECSVELKKVANVKGWWRRGVCLKEMGRLEEAREWLREAVEFESAGPDKQGVTELQGLVNEVERLAESRKGKGV